MKPFNLSQHQARNAINVMDWPYGAKCDGVTDDTAALNAAIAAVPAAGGTILIPGVMAISSRINVRKPINFEGTSEGSAYQPVEPAATGFKWIGGVSAGAMMRIGLYGTGTEVLWGGGLSHLRFDGGGVCAHGLELADASNGEYADIYIFNVTASGLHLISDGTKTAQPSMQNCFYSLYCDMRAALGPSANAHGILIEAVNGAGAGVTLNYFEDLKITHSTGDGIRWNKGGDGMVFMKPQIYRHDSETGWGVNFASTDPNDICNHCIFYYPIISGGAYFAAPGLHIGTAFHDFDGQNVAVNMGANPVWGPGMSEVHGNTTFGQLFGQSRLLSNQDVLRADPMNFIKYDNSVFPALLTTGQGTWSVVSNGGTSGVIETPVMPGGACRLQTQAVLNDAIILLHCKDATKSGLDTAQIPSAQFTIVAPSVAAVRARWGFMSNNADPPTDGAWVEFDSAVGGGLYYLCCSKGGAVTRVANTFGFTAATNQGRWRIDLLPGCANFYFSAAQTPQPQLQTLMASLRTNVPLGGLFCGASLKTLDAVQKSLDLVDIRLAHRIDMR